MGNCYQRAPNLHRAPHKILEKLNRGPSHSKNEKLISKVSNNEVRIWKRLQCVGEYPCDRSGHGAIVIGSKAYIFGGCGGPAANGTCLNDFYSFDFETHEWSRIIGSGAPPSARASFAMCAGPDGGTMIIAGGTGDQSEGLQGDIYEYNVHIHSWRKLVSSGQCPKDFCRYYGQSMCHYQGDLIFFGGSTGTQYIDDVFKYNIDTTKCEKLETVGDVPSPRYKHQVLVIGDRMYIFGGGNYKPPTERIDIYYLDLRSLVWTKVEARGSIPQSRVAHSCVYDPKTNMVFLWGGFTSTLERLQDFHTFDVENEMWSSTQVSGKKDTPSPRAFHSSCFFQSAIYIFGGADGDKRHSDMWRYQVRAQPSTLMMLAAQTIQQSEQLKKHFEQLPDELRAAINQIDVGLNRFSRARSISDQQIYLGLACSS